MARKRIKLPKNFISNAWQLLKSNKQLYWLPLINLLITSILLFIFISVMISSVFAPNIQHASDAVHFIVLKVILALLSILLIPLVTNIINAAVIFYCHAIKISSKISITSALLLAIKKSPKLILWSAIQGTFGLLLNLIDNTHDTIADLVCNMIFGAAWGLISFFVLPTLVIEKTNPFTAIKSSVHMVKHIWGKRAIIRLGVFGLIFTGLMLSAIAILIIGWSMQNHWSFVVMGLGALYFIAIAYTRRLMMNMIQMELYLAVKSGEYNTSVE